MKVTTSSLAHVGTQSERDLIARAKSGQVGALRVIMEKNNARLFRVARSVLGDESEAEDVVQETYLNAFRSIAGFRGDSTISTWLTRIALNDALRRLRRRPITVDLSHVEHVSANPTAQVIPFPPGASDPDPERAMARRQIAELLEQAIDGLPDKFRIVFVLRAVEEMSVEEVAQLLAVPEATVKTRLHRAKRLLRRSLEEEIGTAIVEAFPFAGQRCARLTELVLSRLANGA